MRPLARERQPELVFRAAHPALRPYVQVFQHSAERAGPTGRRRQVPSGGVVLIMNFGSPFRRLEPLDGAIELRHAWLGGPRDRWVLTEPTGSVCCLEAHLTPIGAHRLLGVPMHVVANRAVKLEDVLGADAPLLWERLQEVTCWQARFDLLEGFIAERIEASAVPDAAVVWAWRQLQKHAGAVEISALAHELGLSQKRLITGFRNTIGLTPKRVARVLRFRRATDLLQQPDCVPSLGEVAHACGYYDQAHLNRDFLELSGITPGRFLARRLGPGRGLQDP